MKNDNPAFAPVNAPAFPGTPHMPTIEHRPNRMEPTPETADQIGGAISAAFQTRFNGKMMPYEHVRDLIGLERVIVESVLGVLASNSRRGAE